MVLWLLRGSFSIKQSYWTCLEVSPCYSLLWTFLFSYISNSSTSQYSKDLWKIYSFAPLPAPQFLSSSSWKNETKNQEKSPRMFCSKVLPYLVKRNNCIVKQITSSVSVLQLVCLGGDLCHPANSHLPCIHQPTHTELIPQDRLNQEEISQVILPTPCSVTAGINTSALPLVLNPLSKAMMPALGVDMHPPPRPAPKTSSLWAGCALAPPAAPLQEQNPAKVIETCS